MTVGIGGLAICLERLDIQPKAHFQLQHSEAALGPILSMRGSEKRVSNGLADWFYGGFSKKTLKTVRKVIKFCSPKEITESTANLLTILSFLAAIGLSILVGVLSCSLACAGSQALSVLVLIGGIPLVKIMLVKTLKRIRSQPRKIKAHKTSHG